MNESRRARYLNGGPVGSPDLIPSINEAHLTGAKAIWASALGLRVEQAVQVTQYVHRLATPLDVFIDDDGDFDIGKIGLNVADQDRVFLVWDDWLDVDETSFEVLRKEFRNIWYPVADDLDVYDARGRWALLIDHNGQVKLYQPT